MIICKVPVFLLESSKKKFVKNGPEGQLLKTAVQATVKSDKKANVAVLSYLKIIPPHPLALIFYRFSIQGVDLWSFL